MHKIIIGQPLLPRRTIPCKVISSVPSIVVSDEMVNGIPAGVNWIDERGWSTLVAIIGDNGQYENGWIDARPIEAIKLVRDVLRLSGDIGLKEAKAIIDSVRNHTWKSRLDDAIIEIY